MGDMGDDFRAMRKASQDKRARNREYSAKALTGAGIRYESKNGGAHLIVRHEGRTADFWPGTGKYSIRGGKQGRGVFNLIRALR